LHLAGASSVHVVPEPLAAAVGSGIDISDDHARMLIDIGDGVTDIAVIRSGELIHSTAIRKACSDFHQAIRELIKQRYRMSITREDSEGITRNLIVRISIFLKALPDDIAAEISESGIYLTGGGSRLTGMAERIQSETGIVTTCVDDPLRAVIYGASKMLDVSIATNLWQH
jgi:rod shape-determining protein MreB